jgi:hypothetical protein
MIICYDKSGQLCNRLWSFVPIIAHCIDKDSKLLVLFFDEYIHLFPNIKNNNLVRFKKISNNKFILKLAASLLSKVVELSGLSFKGELSGLKEKSLFVNAWKHSKESFNESYKNQIIDLFKPHENIIEEVDTFFEIERMNIDCIVGVHIRRGDYKFFKDGIYFYDDATYLGFMIDMEKQLEFSGKTVKFLLSSDEEINLNNYKINSLTLPDSSVMKDLYSLSKCDYIIGPPSTFSQWASFIGNVPLKLIHDKEDALILSSFEIKEVFGRGQM